VTGLTRRDLLVRTGAAYLVVVGAGAGAALGRAAGEPGALAPERRATVDALLRGLATDPESGVARDQVDVLTGRVEQWHAQAPADHRAHVDALIDRIREQAATGDLAALPDEAVLAELRAWAAAGDDLALRPHPLRELAASAIDVAGLRPDEDESRSVRIVLTAAA
jgi:hypothetical protein